MRLAFGTSILSNLLTTKKARSGAAPYSTASIREGSCPPGTDFSNAITMELNNFITAIIRVNIIVNIAFATRLDAMALNKGLALSALPPASSSRAIGRATVTSAMDIKTVAIRPTAIGPITTRLSIALRILIKPYRRRDVPRPPIAPAISAAGRTICSFISLWSPTALLKESLSLSLP